MSPLVPGAYQPQHDHDIEEPQVHTPAIQLPEPYPGTEAGGPPLVDLVRMLERVAIGQEALYRQARWEATRRIQRGVTNGATDANGDAILPLFQVPQGATGYLMLCTLDEAGVTPAAPDTNANLYHGIYATNGPVSRAADVIAVGQLLDTLPDAATAGDFKIPAVYKYPDAAGAPSLVGPGFFVVYIDAATATRQVAARWAVLVEQPEP